jgi:hypothetical protein
MSLTRRDLLHRVAAAGGASLVYEAMTGLGLLEAQTRAAARWSGCALPAPISRATSPSF